MIDLALVWAGVIAFGIFMYVVMDGFDLGIGILFPFFPQPHDRDVMMNTVAPIWDGNETWMVLGGAGLYAAFPVAYATVLPALYLPLVIMVISLIFRGVAFEFRFKAARNKRLWDNAFIVGSIATAVAQGIVLGAFIQGIEVRDHRFTGGAFDWLTPFSLFTALGVVAAYAALGCGWLIMKTHGDLQRTMFRLMPPLTLVLLAIFGAISLWTPLRHPEIARRWFSLPQFIYLSPVPILVALSAWGVIHAVRKRSDSRPFLYALALITLAFIGFVISIWPHIVPPSLTFWDASSPRSSQLFTLVGAAILIPIILGYTAMSYWVFRGKVHHADQGYH